MRLFDIPQSDGQTSALAELAPASSGESRLGYTSIWRLGGSDDALMVCLYDGSGTYYQARLHPAPTICSAHDDNGLTQAWCDWK